MVELRVVGRWCIDPGRVDPGIVDQDVEPATHAVEGRIGKPVTAGRRSVEVGSDEVSAAASTADARHHGTAALGVATGHDDMGPAGGEDGGDRTADVAGGSGDEGGSPLQGRSHADDRTNRILDQQVQKTGYL